MKAASVPTTTIRFMCSAFPERSIRVSKHRRAQRGYAAGHHVPGATKYRHIRGIEPLRWHSVRRIGRPAPVFRATACSRIAPRRIYVAMDRGMASSYDLSRKCRARFTPHIDFTVMRPSRPRAACGRLRTTLW